MLDADGQHNPEDIPKLIEPLHNEEADMVIGSRYIRPEEQDIPLYRRFGLGVIDRIFTQSISENITDSQSGYRSFTRQTAQKMIETKHNGFGADSEQIKLAKTNGVRILEVPVIIQYNGLDNTSKKNPLTHGAEIISTILNLVITERPILLIGTPGIFSLLMGIIALGFFIFYYNLNGYISIPFALLTATGVILGTMLILVSLVLYSINEVSKHVHK